MIVLPILTISLTVYTSLQKGWENVLFELGSERVNLVLGQLDPGFGVGGWSVCFCVLKGVLVIAHTCMAASGFLYTLYLITECSLLQVSDMFYQVPKEHQSNIVILAKNHKLYHAITLSPVKDPQDMFKLHQYYTELQLNKTFVDTRAFQTSIKDMLPYLPDGES